MCKFVEFKFEHIVNIEPSEKKKNNNNTLENHRLFILSSHMYNVYIN